MLDVKDTLLSARWYLDESILAREIRQLFSQGPRYVGHELSVPNVGDHRPVTLDDGQELILTRSAKGPEVLVNACRHRQATIVTEPGNSRHIQCPFHRWTYAHDGTLLGAPHFPVNPCRNLFKIPTSSWNGLVLAGPAPVARDLAQWGAGSVFDFSRYSYHSSAELKCNQNWKTFIEVYLDLYHVSVIHKGLGGFVTCENLGWTMGEFFSVQTVGLQDLTKVLTPVYGAWQDAVRAAHPVLPRDGAVWLFYYPGLMLEWNPGAIIVSVLCPQTPRTTLNRVEFFYDTEILEKFPDYPKLHQASYFETAAEDERLGAMMDRGRATLRAGDRSDAGPIQDPMENGIPHFHEYVLRHMGELEV